MKATNNLNLDLKGEIGELHGKVGKLQMFFEDSEEHMSRERDQIKKEAAVVMKEKDEVVADAIEERDLAKQEVMAMKSDYNLKTTQIKLLEMELEEKLRSGEDDRERMEREIAELEGRLKQALEDSENNKSESWVS